MIHALVILAFMMIAAPLAGFIPLAALAGVLAVVAWNMIEKEAFLSFLRASRGEASVLMVTFLLTVFRDLTEAIVVGFALGAVLFIARMSTATEIRTAHPEEGDPTGGSDPDVVVYRIRGAFFFGAAAAVSTVLERIADSHRALIIDFSDVPLVDSSAAHTIEGLVHKAARRGVRVMLTGTTHAMRVEFFAHGLKPPHVSYETSIEKGRRKLHHMLNGA